VPDQAIPLLVECTADPDDGLRMNAVLALKAAAPEAVSQVVSRLIDDPNLRIRLVAANFLLVENPAEPRAGAVLVEALAEPAAGLRKRAMEAVESLGPQAADFLKVYQERLEVEVEPETRGQLVEMVERLTLQPTGDGEAAEAEPEETAEVG
jgi:HEAT repeat protein